MNMRGNKLIRDVFLRRFFLRRSQTSLSMIWRLGLCPVVLILPRRFCTPLLIHVPDMDERDYIKMALLS